MSSPICTKRSKHSREGAAAVEFAFVAPILVALLLGMIEAASLSETSNHLRLALRQSARLAGMDRGEILEPGQSTNDKIIADLKNFLSASGIDGSTADVTITGLDGGAIDLDDPAAEYALFELSVTIPYENALQSTINGGQCQGLTRSYTFRNARNASLCN